MQQVRGVQAYQQGWPAGSTASLLLADVLTFVQAAMPTAAAALQLCITDMLTRQQHSVPQLSWVQRAALASCMLQQMQFSSQQPVSSLTELFLAVMPQSHSNHILPVPAVCCCVINKHWQLC
jgi:hypothetical protein